MCIGAFCRDATFVQTFDSKTLVEWFNVFKYFSRQSRVLDREGRGGRRGRGGGGREVLFHNTCYMAY